MEGSPVAKNFCCLRHLTSSDLSTRFHRMSIDWTRAFEPQI